MIVSSARGVCLVCKSEAEETPKKVAKPVKRASLSGKAWDTPHRNSVGSSRGMFETTVEGDHVDRERRVIKRRSQTLANKHGIGGLKKVVEIKTETSAPESES